MAIIKILRYGDSILRSKTRDVLKISRKIQILVEDMIDTMYANNGVGLAATQVGVDLRIFVMDTTPSNKPPNPLVFINPKIIKKSGAILSNESCLSFPNAFINVRRYENVTVKALDSRGKSFVLESNGDTLQTRAIQHEFDHLEGILFIDHARNRFEAESELAKAQLPPLETDKMLNEPELEEIIQKKESSV